MSERGSSKSKASTRTEPKSVGPSRYPVCRAGAQKRDPLPNRQGFEMPPQRRRLLAITSSVDIHTLGVLEEESADDDGHDGDADRVPQTVIDIARRRDHRGRQQRQHAAEPAIADVIWQRHRGVADLRREELDEVGG